MAREWVDGIVIGAGVIGLACARALVEAGRDVIVLEANNMIGAETSSRNSEVIHAGIYYPPGSLKARFCIAGKRALYDYMNAHGLPHKRCGKLIVATNEEQSGRLAAIAANAAEIGCDDLKLLSKTEILDLEPALNAQGGILSPSTGILDVHAFMLSLQGEFEAHGGVIAFESPVELVRIGDRKIVDVGGREPLQIEADVIVNAAGLKAVPLARLFEGFPANTLPEAYYARGNYFSIARKPPFSHLIYPVPEQAGLGIHLTLDMAGQARFGPDVEWIDEIDYSQDADRAALFYPAIRDYWPALEDGALQPAYTGIRPKIQAPGEPARDFMIQGPADHGIPGLVNLFGIESPGLTSSLAIADYVLDLL
jgi:L-2-hydroxyglutarate oxidase LhgO